MNVGIFAILFILAFNCSAQNWPNWVIQPQQSIEYIAAVGIGESRLAAKQAAIAEINTQLSVDVTTQQLQKLTKKNTQADSYFEQATTVTSLPFTLTGLVELKSLQKNNLFAIKIGVKKSVLVKNLTSELAALSRLSVPKNSAEQRFIWALQNSKKLEDATKKLAVLEHLSGTNLSINTTLNYLLDEHAMALNAISCDVIGANDLSAIKSVLNTALPQSGSVKLWMRPQVHWQYAQSNKEHLVKAKLTLALTRSQSPFTVLLQHDLFAQESAATQENAKQKVINNFVQQLKAPASQWLFDI